MMIALIVVFGLIALYGLWVMRRSSHYTEMIAGVMILEGALAAVVVTIVVWLAFLAVTHIHFSWN